MNTPRTLEVWDRSHAVPWTEAEKRMRAAGFSEADITAVLGANPTQRYRAAHPPALVEAPAAPEIEPTVPPTAEEVTQLAAAGASLFALAKQCGVSYNTAYARLRSGWTLEDALLKPTIDCQQAGKLGAKATWEKHDRRAQA